MRKHMANRTSEKFSSYYLGLDIGTDSVGWAVTDLSYNILQYHHKDMWGIHLFEGANTAAERRGFRTARRRRDRAKNRLKWLRDLFKDAIHGVDPDFFKRIDEARLHRIHRTPDINGYKAKNTLFDDPDYCDADYYESYPTIYHLRAELMHPWDYQHDIRLVYLAIAHILKSRGNFLFQGATFETGHAFDITYHALMETAQNCGLAIPDCDLQDIKEAFRLKGIK